MYDGYNDGPASPLFYFGMGLSYTTFAMDNLKVTPISAGHVVLAIELSVSVSAASTKIIIQEGLNVVLQTAKCVCGT